MKRMMFQENYKKAYEAIVPDSALVEKMLLLAEGQEEQKEKTEKSGLVRVVRPMLTVAAAIGAFVIIMSLTVMPALAANVPAVYRFLQGISPALADFFVPIEKSCTKKGITMQVESVYVEGNRAEVYISFQDADGAGNVIDGEIDLWTGYGLQSRTGCSVIGGHNFAGYDAETGKSYWKVSLQGWDDFETDKLTFYVYSILSKISEEKRELDLREALTEAELKNVTLRGGSWTGWTETTNCSVQRTDAERREDPRPVVSVMKGKPVGECLADGFTVTGIAFLDGNLRVQICMGDQSRAVRHVSLFLTDKEGNERICDNSVVWKESWGGVDYTFYEYVFADVAADTDAYALYGLFFEESGYVEGNWSVTFTLEPDEQE